MDPWFEIPPPGWVLRHLERLEPAFALRRLGPEVRWLEENEQVFGANMAFRTELLRITPFNPALGRIGRGMVGADETNVISRLRKEGWRGVWIGSARVKHYIPASRLTRGYVWKYYTGLGQTAVRTSACPSGGPTLWGAPRWLVRLTWSQRFRAFARRLTGRDWVEVYIAAAMRTGMIREVRAQTAFGDAKTQSN